jgi:hypothetical protein
MCTPPSALLNVIVRFAPVFSKRVWRPAQVLLIGAILTPGKRRVTAALRAMGLDWDAQRAHCPQGHASVNWRPGLDGPAGTCACWSNFRRIEVSSCYWSWSLSSSARSIRKGPSA